MVNIFNVPNTGNVAFCTANISSAVANVVANPDATSLASSANSAAWPYVNPVSFANSFASLEILLNNNTKPPTAATTSVIGFNNSPADLLNCFIAAADACVTLFVSFIFLKNAAPVAFSTSSKPSFNVSKPNNLDNAFPPGKASTKFCIGSISLAACSCTFFMASATLPVLIACAFALSTNAWPVFNCSRRFAAAAVSSFVACLSNFPFLSVSLAMSAFILRS